MSYLKFNRENEIGYFKPKEWNFWRSLITSFCVMCILGHILEFIYCVVINNLFYTIESDYAVWNDPIFHPYWVYGFGAVFMTLIIEPLKEFLIVKSNSLFKAVVLTLFITIALSAVMELSFGLLVNQPDEFGVYPFWDNSQLPLNIFGQAWLVNDIFIGIGATIYVWIVYPAICEVYCILKEKANILFLLVIILFGSCCFFSYSQLLVCGLIEI